MSASRTVHVPIIALALDHATFVNGLALLMRLPLTREPSVLIHQPCELSNDFGEVQRRMRPQTASYTLWHVDVLSSQERC
jgi:hypothetical protein